jgi:hypothetical protein
MPLLDAILLADTGTGPRRLRLSNYLDGDGAEAAALEAYAWIKALRHARVGGEPLRQRFTYRGDSLWWFAELYLHKDRTIQTLFEAIRAAEALIDAERPLAIEFERADRTVRTAVAAAGRIRNIRCPRAAAPARRRLAAMDARSAALALTAMLSPRRGRAARHGPPVVAAFVHRAFWSGNTGADSGAESYIGPVLQALEARLPSDGVRHIGLGPPTNFRARRWWRPGPGAPRRIVPIERLAPRSAMRGSWTLWKSRHRIRRDLLSSEDLRKAAMIRGCDCWTVVREVLDGVALLQFPWSARAMDEARAALDALRPAVAVTYAEAGGWGRALALEARRTHVPLVGLQHGFIYRHWLNYRHEPDEMMPPAEGSQDSGFPRPALTLVFDEYAADHLTEAARFPREAVAVTGSPRLDALAREASALTQEAIEAARRRAGASAGEPLILIVSKYTEIRRELPALIAAIRELPDVRAVIKTHPAETPAPYEAVVAHAANVRVLPAAAPLAPLLRGAQLVVTVNSTVAIDSLALGIPALTIGAPNNLTPFVAAGAMAGTSAGEEIGPAIRRVLYDPGFRQQLGTVAAAVAARYRIAADGRAAERSATAILGLAASHITES